MTYLSCPTAVVDAPVDVVWDLLTDPERWGNFYDVRVTAVEPPGAAHVGQRIHAEAGPRFLHLKLVFEFAEVDAERHLLGFTGRFPLGMTVREDMSCVAVGTKQCRVNYHCLFGFPEGWRGAVARALLRRELDAGPSDSLDRLKRAAERVYAGGN